jgi:hypothetical protein
MMTHDLQISIIAAPLAAIDRRALSQAWYSALHLAHAHARHAKTRAKPPPPTAVTINPRTSRNASTHRQACVLPRSTSIGRNSRDPLGDAAAAPQARGRRDEAPLARAIGNAFFNARSTVKRATFSMGGEGGRVHVVLQTKGNRLTLVALCPPQMHDAVARALSGARLSLRARGITCS